MAFKEGKDRLLIAKTHEQNTPSPSIGGSLKRANIIVSSPFLCTGAVSKVVVFVGDDSLSSPRCNKLRFETSESERGREIGLSYSARIARRPLPVACMLARAPWHCPSDPIGSVVPAVGTGNERVTGWLARWLLVTKHLGGWRR